VLSCLGYAPVPPQLSRGPADAAGVLRAVCLGILKERSVGCLPAGAERPTDKDLEEALLMAAPDKGRIATRGTTAADGCGVHALREIRTIKYRPKRSELPTTHLPPAASTELHPDLNIEAR